MGSVTASATSSTELPLRAKNAGAAAAVVCLASTLHALAPWNRSQMREWYAVGDVVFSGEQFLAAASVAYGLLVVAWQLAEREPQPGKSLQFFGFVARVLRAPRAVLTGGVPAAERVAVLTTLLKTFFAPLMVMSLLAFCMGAWKNGQSLLAALDIGFGAQALFNRWGFWFLLQLLLFVDVAIFTVGYLVETKRLRNEIRSVDPTWLGWAVALACYPPFNTYTAKILGSQHDDFPRFDDPVVHAVLNGLLLLLMAVYASASVALGLKASNLTHRGIVARGPYAVVRHPAYACKNMAWWIGAVPVVSAAFERDAGSGWLALASVAGWTLVYVLRALTEEHHLRRVDGEYAAYAAKVRWRFVPGVV